MTYPPRLPGRILQDLRLAGDGIVDAVRAIYSDAAGNASVGMNPADIVSGRVHGINERLSQLFNSPLAPSLLPQIYASYAASIGYYAPPTPPPPTMPPHSVGSSEGIDTGCS